MSVVDRIAKEVNDKNYDIVHCHGARANFIALFLRFKIKKPFITTIHSDYKLDFKDNLYKRFVFTSLNTFALKRFKYFIAVSDSFKDMLVSRGFKKDRIFTVYNGINLEQNISYLNKEDFLKKYKIPFNGEVLVGIMARLDLVKDHETFLKAAKYALEINPNIKFLIAGDGGERENLENLTLDLNLQDKVHFLGYIKDVYSFLNALDINTLTSVSESFPYAILEGAYMKKPIISTRVGGLVKLIEDGKNGYLVDVRDYVSLGEKIAKLSEDPTLRQRLGDNLYKKVELNYSSRKMAEDHIKAYEKILENNKKENHYD